MFSTQYASVGGSNELLGDLHSRGQAYPSYYVEDKEPEAHMMIRGGENYQTKWNASCAPCEASDGSTEIEFHPKGRRSVPGYQKRPQSRSTSMRSSRSAPMRSPPIRQLKSPIQSRPVRPKSSPNSRPSARQLMMEAKREKQQMVSSPILAMMKKSVQGVMNQLGAEPDWADLSSDGGAIWKFSNIKQGKSLWSRVFTRVEVHGVNKPSARPVPHYGFVTTHTNMKLNPELAAEIQEELPMISYCPSTQTLRITMDTLEHNLAILALVCGIQQDKLSYSKVKYYDLVKKYMALTTPGNRSYRRGAKYSLVKFIHSK